MENIKYIDEEEKEIIESLKNIDVSKIKNDKSNIEDLKNAAQDYIAKQDKMISLRISSKDLNKIKAIASKKGIRYQTLMKSVLHQYVDKFEDVKSL